jgi:hypothetical protein
MPDQPRTEHPGHRPRLDPAGTVATAGAYVVVDGRFAFMLGPTPDGTRLAVVRLGGHREHGEPPWQCAEREVWEESSLRVVPRQPPGTYWLQAQDDTATSHETLMAGNCPAELSEPAPILLVRGHGAHASRLSAMYLAHGKGAPAPCNEAHGILLLGPAEVFGILSRPVTLRQHLRSGGQAILRSGLPQDLPLEPFRQLRVLAALLNLHPNLAI